MTAKTQRTGRNSNATQRRVAAGKTCVGQCGPSRRNTLKRRRRLVTLKNDDASVHALLIRRSGYHLFTVGTFFSFQTFSTRRDTRLRPIALPTRPSPVTVDKHVSSPFYFTRRDFRRRQTNRPTSGEPKMSPIGCAVLVAVASLCAAASAAAGCKYSVESYTTTDAMIVTEAAFIAQITAAECEDSPSSLYAEVEGKLVVAANAGPNKYQVKCGFLAVLSFFFLFLLYTTSRWSASSRFSRSAGWTTSRRPAVVITPSSCTTRPATGSSGNCCATESPSAAWRPSTLRTCVTPARTKGPGWIPSSWPPSLASWSCILRTRSSRKLSPKS